MTSRMQLNLVFSLFAAVFAFAGFATADDDLTRTAINPAVLQQNSYPTNNSYPASNNSPTRNYGDELGFNRDRNTGDRFRGGRNRGRNWNRDRNDAPVYQPDRPDAPGGLPWTPEPPAAPVTPTTPEPTRPTKPTPQMEITSRYQDPRMLNFLAAGNLNQLVSLYLEVSQMIDARHVNPLSYEVRTQQALETLAEAVNNPAYLQANGISPNPTAISNFQSQLTQLAQTQPARSANEAVGMMQWAADIGQRELGLRPEAVALEFLNGTLDALDPYSSFIPAQTGLGPGAGLEEHIVGIGVELKADEAGALVMGVLEGGPAAEARLQKGDLIVGIDGRSVTGQGLNQIADLITGPSGTSVRLQIRRDGRDYNATLVRRSIYVSSVAGTQMIDAETGYVRLKQFSESSAEDLGKAMWDLYNRGMNTLVLDLRGNPGGLLTEAIQVSDLFLPQGTIVSTKGRNAQDNMMETANWSQTWRLPLVVLVDEYSASASEIFAAAIQENGRGVIVGRRTYGKGTVQTHFPLRTVSGELKLTTAKFYSPNGREMAGAGVTPDVTVAAGSDVTDLQNDADVRAALQVIASNQASDLASNAGQRSGR
ncbi:S41 family peptidase [Maioricimonas sp. JC845]|uniref:S41 family peptidase n=1 Tax=Maioricimonas sp. JC845 TaxID=3232138 RepID=UPI003458520A